MKKIYYIVPDIFPRDFNLRRAFRAWKMGKLKPHIESYWLGKQKPIGGVKVMYQHCMLLRELGYDAIPLQMGRYNGNLFDYDIEAQSVKDTGYNLGHDAVIVAPEITPHILEKFTCGLKIMFAQNWRRTYSFFDHSHVKSSYIDLGYDHILCVGEYIRDTLTRDNREDITVISNFIDHSIFKPDTSKRINRRVLGLPRKNKNDLDKIRSIVKQLGIEITYVDGLSQTEIRDEYQKSDIFLTVGYPEGFGLPQLEAMACGCSVVGFTGGGAREFMVDGETALVAEDGDCEKAAALLASVISDEKQKESIRQNGLAKAASYSSKKTKKQLAEFYSELLL